MKSSRGSKIHDRLNLDNIKTLNDSNDDQEFADARINDPYISIVSLALGHRMEIMSYGYVSAIVCLLFGNYIDKVSLKNEKLFNKPKEYFIDDKRDVRILEIYDNFISANPDARCLLAGGKVVDYLIGTSLENSTGDYDLWFTSVDAFKNARIYFHRRMCEIDGTEQREFVETDNDHNATFVSKVNGLQFQLIKTIFGDIDEILKNFDFNCACVAYDGVDIYWAKGALKSIKNKTLDVRFPRMSRVYHKRLSKYIKKGFIMSHVDMNLIAIATMFGLDNRGNRDIITDVAFDRFHDRDYLTPYD